VARTVQELESRLQESEELLRAIRTGEVDALVVSGPHGDQVYTLSGADHPYRVMVEAMSEGAVILTADGTIFYSNRSFAAILDAPLEEVTGSKMGRFVLAEDLPRFDTLTRQIDTGINRGEIRLTARDGSVVSVQLSISSFGSGTPGSACAVVTDLTTQKRNQALVSAELLERTKGAEAEAGQRRIASVLESITDSFFSLDREWRITDANERAATNFGTTRDALIGTAFWDVSPRDRIPDLDQQYRRAMTQRIAIHFEAPSAAAPGRWFERHIYPTDVGLAIYSRDITERKQSEEALRASEERFRRAFDLGLIGMALTTPSKGCLEVNDELCRILGYEREELLRLEWPDITHPDDLAAEVAAFNRVMAGEIDSYSLDKRWIRKDGRTVASIMAARCVRRADGSVDYFIGLVQDITERKRAEDELRRSEAERGRLLRQVVQAQEDERRRIALEMHDQFGQQLSALLLKLSALRRDRGQHADLANDLASLEAIARRLDADLELLVWRLRPTVLDDLGLAPALTNYVNRWSDQFEVHTELDVRGIDRDRLTSDIETALYRIMQEALHNIAKYARASRVAVLLEGDADRLSLIVEDNGIGFDVDRWVGSDHRFGLTGMRERAALLGGTLDIESVPGKGATIVARIPIPARPSESVT
jgi:two-component system sensor histidine kinase UhpB